MNGRTTQSLQEPELDSTLQDVSECETEQIGDYTVDSFSNESESELEPSFKAKQKIQESNFSKTDTK
jgi:hypothetical protein